MLLYGLLFPGLFLLCILIGMIPAQAEEYYTEGFFQYMIEKEQISICSYFGRETEVTIPEKIAGYPVTTIKETAFSGKDEIKIITIPYTVTTVDKNVFLDMKQLERIILKSDQVTVQAAEYVIVVEDFPRYVKTEERKGEDKEENTKGISKEEKKEDTKKDSKENAAENFSETEKYTSEQDRREDLQKKENTYDFAMEIDTSKEEEDSINYDGITSEEQNVYVTIDQDHHLIAIDQQGNVTRLEKEKEYYLGYNGAGEKVIVDSDWKELQISGKNILLPNGEKIELPKGVSQNPSAKEQIENEENTSVQARKSGSKEGESSALETDSGRNQEQVISDNPALIEKDERGKAKEKEESSSLASEIETGIENKTEETVEKEGVKSSGNKDVENTAGDIGKKSETGKKAIWGWIGIFLILVCGIFLVKKYFKNQKNRIKRK